MSIVYCLVRDMLSSCYVFSSSNLLRFNFLITGHHLFACMSTFSPKL